MLGYLLWRLLLNWLLTIRSLRSSHLLGYLLWRLVLNWLLILLTRLCYRCYAIPEVTTLRWIVAILRRSASDLVGLSLWLHLDLLLAKILVRVEWCRCGGCHSAWSAVTTIAAMTC